MPKVTTKRRPSKGNSAGDALVTWYRAHHRHLPWRAPPGHTNDPYHVWLSEIMLQQTTVPTVIAYYNKFLTLWPTLDDLARATQDDVLREWAGLGYYSRARNLHKCAQVVMDKHDGVFPADVDALLDLPGIGPYTASAIGAIAFGLPVMPVDGNIERVITRLHTIDQPVASAKPRIKQLAQAMLDHAANIYPGDLAQGLMDLGAGVCTPRNPKCTLCPLRAHCQAFTAGNPQDYPVANPKKDKPTRYGIAYMVENRRGEFMAIKRADTGLFAGMMGLPTTDWTTTKVTDKYARQIGQVRHSFTHFNLVLDVVHVDHKHDIIKGMIGTWHPVDTMLSIGLPRVFTKVVELLARS